MKVDTLISLTTMAVFITYPHDWPIYLQNVTRVIKKDGVLRIKAFSRNCAYFEENAGHSLSSWVQLKDSGYTYFFSERDIRQLFSKSFEILKLEENVHTETDDKKFFFVLLRAL